MASKKPPLPAFVNKKVGFSYTLLDHYQAGMVLRGSEIKAIRMHKVNLKEAYCLFKGTELWVSNLHLGAYGPAAQAPHNLTRLRKLLLTKQELGKLQRQQAAAGAAIVVYKLFMDLKQRAKLEIALAKGKKLYDKREAIKVRDLKRRLQQEPHG